MAIALASATVFTSVPMQSMPVYAAEKGTAEVVETYNTSEDGEELELSSVKGKCGLRKTITFKVNSKSF